LAWLELKFLRRTDPSRLCTPGRTQELPKTAGGPERFPALLSFDDLLEIMVVFFHKLMSGDFD
jgi:hypothetical protein